MKKRELSAILVALFLFAGLLACGEAQEERAAEKGDKLVAERVKESADVGGGVIGVGTKVIGAAGLKITLPSGWTRETPSSTIRVAQFRVLGEGGQPEPGEIAIFHFGPGGGGDVQANLERWAGQFQQEEGSDPMTKAKTAVQQVGDLKITTIETAGHYKTQAIPGAAGVFDEEGWHLLGAVIEGPGGPWFIKAVGPDAVITSQRDAFETMLKGLTLTG